MVTGDPRSIKKLVIIPAYNEEDTIVQLCKEVQDKAPGYDIIVINDHSDDGTLTKCISAGIHVLDLSVNLGIGGAMQAGYRYAADNGYDIAVQVDGDGQHDPQYLSGMLEQMTDADADMVIGSRFLEREGYQSTVLRRWGIRYLTTLIKILTREKVTDPTSGYRMVRGEVIKDFAKDYPQDYPEPESIVWMLMQGHKVVEVPVMMRERGGGKSSIRARDSVYYIIKVTIAILLERMQK